MNVNSTMIAAVDTIRYVDTFIHPDVGKLSDKYPVMPASNFSNMTIHVSSYLDAKFGSDITKVILGYANYKQTDMYIGVFCPNSKSIQSPDFKDFTVCSFKKSSYNAELQIRRIISKQTEYVDYGAFRVRSGFCYDEYDSRHEVMMLYNSKALGSYLVFKMTNPNPKFN